MSNLLLSRRSDNLIEGSSFIASISDGNVSFSLGKVFPIHATDEKQKKGIYPNNISEEFEITKSGEFYLRVATNPFSLKIELVEIISKENIDDLNVDSGLNSFIPIVRIDKDTEKVREKGLQRDLIWNKKQNAPIGRAYVYSENVIFSPYLTKLNNSYGEVSEGKQLSFTIGGSPFVIKTNGTLTIDTVGTSGDTEIETAMLIIDTPSFSVYSYKPSTITLGEGSQTADAPEEGDHSLSSSFPVGYVDTSYNYVRLIDGNFSASSTSGGGGETDFDGENKDKRAFHTTKVGIIVG
mgnify:CR=1 FL=1